MAAANIPIESLVDNPLDNKHYPNRLFEDRSGKFDEFTGAFVIYGLNHEKKTEKQHSVHDYVCDAIWDMGFDAKPDFFFNGISSIKYEKCSSCLRIEKDAHETW